MTTNPLVRPGETPQDALRRLDRLPGPQYTVAIESDAGQALLAMLRARRRAALRARPTERAEVPS